MPPLLSIISPARQRHLALVLGIFAAIIVVLAVVFWLILDDYGQWGGLTSHTCDEYCENSHLCNHEMKDRPLTQQPVNTWTNLAFILFGLWPIVAIRVDLSTMVYLLANTYGGMSGFLFHASISELWRQIDVAATSTMLLTLLFHGGHVVTGVSWNWWAVPLMAWSMVVFPLFAHLTGASNAMTILAMTSIAFLDLVLVGAHIRVQPTANRKRRMGCKKAALATLPAVLVILGRFLSEKDESKVWCNPDSAFQAHGVWHVLCATANFCVWMFFDYNRLKDILAKAPREAGQEDDDDDDDDISSKVDDIMDLTDETFDLQESPTQDSNDGTLDLTAEAS